MTSSNDGHGLAYLDNSYAASTLDVEEQYLVVAPKGAIASNDCLAKLNASEYGQLFRVSKRGIVELIVPDSSWHVSVRAAHRNYVGLARYRFLEDDE